MVGFLGGMSRADACEGVMAWRRAAPQHAAACGTVALCSRTTILFTRMLAGARHSADAQVAHSARAVGIDRGRGARKAGDVVLGQIVFSRSVHDEALVPVQRFQFGVGGDGAVSSCKPSSAGKLNRYVACVVAGAQFLDPVQVLEIGTPDQVSHAVHEIAGPVGKHYIAL